MQKQIELFNCYIAQRAKVSLVLKEELAASANAVVLLLPPWAARLGIVMFIFAFILSKEPR
jgi:hypothetical protein